MTQMARMRIYTDTIESMDGRWSYIVYEGLSGAERPRVITPKWFQTELEAATAADEYMLKRISELQEQGLEADHFWVSGSALAH